MSADPNAYGKDAVARPLRGLYRRAVPADVARLYGRAGYVALVGNAVLLAAKALVAWQSGSSAVYADAANSGSDVAYSLLMLIALRLSVTPPDEGHPHGHQRIEPLVSLAIGAMMTLAAVQAAREGVATIARGAREILSCWALGIPIVTGIIKMVMYLYTVRLGRRASSPAIMASASDNLSDVITSAMVLVGVAFSRWGLPVADPIAGLLVAVWILRAAWAVVRVAIRQLIGGSASPTLRETIAELVAGIPGVIAIEQLVVEHVGPQVRADIHVIMDGDLPLSEVHERSHAVRHAVEALEGVDQAYVHVEPARRD